MSEQENKKVIRLDGSHGLGWSCHLTVVLSDKVTGIKEIQYEFPYVLIDFKKLQNAVDTNFILGYRIEKIVPKDAQAYGVLFDQDGMRGISLEEGDGQ